MSDQPSDLTSFFDKIDSKKKKQQTQQQQQAKKAEEQRKKQEEEKKLQATSSSKGQNGATAEGDFESSDEEENRGKIDIVGGGVKDIKQVKKEKQQQDKLKESDNQGWNLGPSTSSNAEAKAAQEQKDKTGFTKGSNIGLKSTQSAGAVSKDGIQFKGRPQFKKSEQVAKQGEFPELGDEHKQPVQQTKASMGGPIGQMSAPARNTIRTQNKFEGLSEETKEKPEPAEAKGGDIVFKSEKPKFSGFKGFLSKQNEENAEANKGLSDLQKKLEEQIKIHDAKPAPRKEGEQGHPAHNGEEAKRPSYNHGGERREGGDRKPRTFEAPKEEKEDSDDGFEQVDGEKRRAGEGRRGGRGGRVGRGGYHKGDDDHERRGPRKDDASKNTTHEMTAKPAQPKKDEVVKIAIPNQNFKGWGDASLF